MDQFIELGFILFYFIFYSNCYAIKKYRFIDFY
jgi:hypothetical protein